MKTDQRTDNFHLYNKNKINVNHSSQKDIK